MGLEPGPAAEGLSAGVTEPGSEWAELDTGGGAVWVQVAQVVAQVVLSVEAHGAVGTGVRFGAAVDQSVTGQTGLGL